MAKRAELAPMLLNEIRLTRPKENESNKDEKQNDNNKSTESKPKPNPNPIKNETEERDIVDELFVLVRKPSFDIASDAYKTLQLLLTRNKKLVPQYLDSNYQRFFFKFNKLIQSDN
eukprot:38244_1